jgi:hypothetical protein
MVHIPALEAIEVRRYRFYVGDNVGHISFWIQYDETDGPASNSYTQEYPIWANTRGIGTFFSSAPEFGGEDGIEPSDAFWNILNEIRQGFNEPISTEGCEWYEQEMLSSMDNLWQQEKNAHEIDSLLMYAMNQANE